MFQIDRSITLLLITAAISLSADKTATTDDGKKVILHDNGRWEYHTTKKTSGTSAESSQKRVHLVELIKNDSRFDFRNVRWGMSKKEVMTAEDGKMIKNRSDTLTYEVTFLGYNCRIMYAFSGDALWKAEFRINQTHIDPALFYKDFDELKRYLTPLYGNPVSDKLEWKNEIYRKDKSKWGFAISIGFLTCRTEWHSNRTRIELKIKGGNHQISTNIAYSSLAG